MPRVILIRFLRQIQHEGRDLRFADGIKHLGEDRVQPILVLHQLRLDRVNGLFACPIPEWRDTDNHAG